MLHHTPIPAIIKGDFTTAVVSCGLYAAVQLHKAPYWSIHKYEDRVD